MTLFKKGLFFLIYFFIILTLGCSFPKFVITRDPLTPQEHINLGLAYEKEGDIESALIEYQKASKSLPTAFFYMGNLFFNQDEFEKAEYYYKKAILKDSKNGDAYNNLAWLYYTKGENLDEAEKLAEQAMRVKPEKSEYYQDTIDCIRKLKSDAHKQ